MRQILAEDMVLKRPCCRDNGHWMVHDLAERKCRPQFAMHNRNEKRKLQSSSLENKTHQQVNSTRNIAHFSPKVVLYKKLKLACMGVRDTDCTLPS